MTQTATEPDSASASAPTQGMPTGEPPWSDWFAFLVAVLMSACRATFEALGYGHPLRIPVVLVVWVVTAAFLGLPKWVLTDPTWSDVLKYGDWRSAAWLAAVVEVGGLFIFQVIFSGPRVAKARQRVPQLGIETLIGRGEELYFMRVGGEEELKRWMERVKAWTALCERELSETLSTEAADTFRRPSVVQVHKHQQRFNEAHNGWLDLLAKRIEALRKLAAGLRPKRHFVEYPDSRA